MQLAVAGVDTERAAQALRQQWLEAASSAEVRAAQHVVDLDAAILECPACGTSFPNSGANGPRICPGCELHL